MTHFRDQQEPKFSSVRLSDPIGDTKSGPVGGWDGDPGRDSMFRCRIAATVTVVLAALAMPTVRAQDRIDDPNFARPIQIPTYVSGNQRTQFASQPVMSPAHYAQPVSMAQAGTPPTPIDADLAQANQAPMVAPQQQGYVRLGAPMYPTPRPNIPAWSGSTIITNQALAPHEMLYPHTYRAIYPPFYHRVKGGWIVTPFGVRSHEHWELQGTQVEVKYRSSYPGLFSGAFWHPTYNLHSSRSVNGH